MNTSIRSLSSVLLLTGVSLCRFPCHRGCLTPHSQCLLLKQLGAYAAALFATKLQFIFSHFCDVAWGCMFLLHSSVADW